MKHLLSGKPLAERILAELRTIIAKAPVVPGLAVILVGDDAASRLYVSLKEKAAKEIGMYFERHDFPETAAETSVLEKITELNRNPRIHGIIVQLPLPPGFSSEHLIEGIDPVKDADGFHPETLRQYFSGANPVAPVFPRAVAHLIVSAGEALDDQKALILANSAVFGRVMTRALVDLGLAVEVVWPKSNADFAAHLANVKVLVTACGEPGLVRGETIPTGAIVIDGGITRRGDQVLGDIDWSSAPTWSGWATPVPGGVGPLTVAFLLKRVTELAFRAGVEE